MTHIKVSEASGPVLDWMVAKCEEDQRSLSAAVGRYWYMGDSAFNPSINWAQGGPIIEREKIEISPPFVGEYTVWAEWKASVEDDAQCFGPTPLIAAMRCYVASKLGDVVDVPDELIGA